MTNASGEIATMLSPDQRHQFSDQGFLPQQGVFVPDWDFGGVIAADDHILDDMEAHPPIRRCLRNEQRRVAELYRQCGNLSAQNVDISLPARPEIPSDTSSALIPRCSHLLSHVNLPDAVADLTGDEISLNPVCHVRIRPPQAVMDRSTNCNELARNV